MFSEASAAQFLEAPIGRFVRGRTFLAWCASETLSGGVSWGRATVEDVEQMIALHEVILRPPLVQGAARVLLDLRALEVVGLEVFSRYLVSVGPRVPRFARAISRQAIVVPDGLLGALVAGFYPLVARPQPKHQLFRELEPAARYVGVDAPLLTQVQALAAPEVEPVLWLAQVRLAVRAQLADAQVAEVAAALRTTPRTLQRRLAAAGTSFREVLDGARKDVVTDALRRGEKQAVIARQLGMTESGLSDWLRERRAELQPAPVAHPLEVQQPTSPS